VLAIDGLALSRSPCEVVTADLNVIVGELAELVVVHTKKLSLLCRAELEAGDLVDDESEDSADSERVGGYGDDVRNLLVDGRWGSSNGTTFNAVVDTVKSDDVVGSEDAVEEESNHSSDAVLSEHIKGIVDLDPELNCRMISIKYGSFTIVEKLTLGGKITNDTSGDTEDNASPRCEVTRSGSGSDKSRNGT
jgi:hypothetical protein